MDLLSCLSWLGDIHETGAFLFYSHGGREWPEFAHISFREERGMHAGNGVQQAIVGQLVSAVRAHRYEH